MATATTMNGKLNMAYETKVLLISMAEYAVEAKIKKMYLYIAKMANAEGLILPSYEDAVAQKEAEEKDKKNQVKVYGVAMKTIRKLKKEIKNDSVQCRASKFMRMKTISGRFPTRTGGPHVPAPFDT